ncbi:MAG: DUF3037 domain-containing protein [Terriglobales bacterium]
MAEQLKQCEFFLLRYVPDAVKGEFVNIGVVLLGPSGIELRFSEDWSRVRCLDPDADLDMLQAVESELRSELSQGESRVRMLEKLRDSFSTSIRLSPVTGCLTESPQAEADLLAQHYLETSAARRVKADRGAGARLKLAAQMRRTFEDAGVWKLMMRKIPAAEYTAAGDPLKIDCGYRPNGVVRLFHAVSLQSSAEGAKLLAYSYPQIQAGMLQKLKLQTELTAIVEENLDRANAEVAFGIAAMERNQILVAASGELGRIAQRARLELKV